MSYGVNTCGVNTDLEFMLTISGIDLIRDFVCNTKSVSALVQVLPA